ncbi:MAG TPA: hypothetical protein VEY30_01410, partial [Myxococcaceae bacterium]|nr:hypothetical protein [Myxococcaceae bacterium]
MITEQLVSAPPLPCKSPSTLGSVEGGTPGPPDGPKTHLQRALEDEQIRNARAIQPIRLAAAALFWCLFFLFGPVLHVQGWEIDLTLFTAYT